MHSVHRTHQYIDIKIKQYIETNTNYLYKYIWGRNRRNVIFK